MKQTKLNLTEVYKSYYTAKTTPEIVEIEEGSFLTIDGKGAPGGKEFQAKVSALYSRAYGVKMLMKREGKDFTVAKLEGLWWVDSNRPYTEVPREEWRWKLLIRQPEFITSGIVEEARRRVVEKKKLELVNEVKFERMKEGKCVQILHIGPYSTEPESIAKDLSEGVNRSHIPACCPSAIAPRRSGGFGSAASYYIIHLLSYTICFIIKYIY